MWLVLCGPHDAAGLWAADGLARRGLTPLVTVTPEAIVCSRQFVHEIANGRGRTTFTLPDGQVIDSAAVRGTLNRVTYLPAAHLAAATDDDRHYGAHELHAVVLSALHGLGARIVNRPTPQGLAGRQRSDTEWLWLAGRAGLRTADRSHGDPACDALPGASAVPDGMSRRVLVLDDCLYGDAVPADIGAGAIALARLADTRLLGIDMIESRQGAWWFAAASTAPELPIGGGRFLDDLAVALDGPGRRR
jgi:hypothetical protein